MIKKNWAINSEEDMSNKFSDRELLIRIDERQKTIVKKLAEMSLVLLGKVDRDEEYERMCEKVQKMWDKWNLAVGYMVGAGVVGGLASKLLSGFASSAMAMFK